MTEETQVPDVLARPYTIWRCDMPGCDWQLNGASRTEQPAGAVRLALHEVKPLIRKVLDHQADAHGC